MRYLCNLEVALSASEQKEQSDKLQRKLEEARRPRGRRVSFPVEGKPTPKNIHVRVTPPIKTNSYYRTQYRSLEDIFVDG